MTRGRSVGTSGGAKTVGFAVAAHRITMKDLYYAAGLLDGEGCFAAGGSYGNTHLVEATMTDEEPIRNLWTTLGGRMTCLKRVTRTGKPLFRWSVGGARARGVMQTLYPLLCSRRQEKIKQCLLV